MSNHEYVDHILQKIKVEKETGVVLSTEESEVVAKILYDALCKSPTVLNEILK